MNRNSLPKAPFYRFEYQGQDNRWYSIFSLFDPSERRFLNRYITEPKWYQSHEESENKCWFTAYGFEKYKKIIQQTIKKHKCTYGRLANIRIRKTYSLEYIRMLGKVQCIGTTTPDTIFHDNPGD